MIQTYNNVGSSTHLYEVSKSPKTGGTLFEIGPDISQYAVAT